MKRIVLFVLAAFMLASCNKDYEEKNWIIFNEYSEDVSVSINNVNYTVKANSTAIANALIGEFTDSPVFKINTDAHLKTVESWYYHSGNTWHLCTIKEQAVVNYVVYYDGSADDVVIVSGLFKNDEGKYKRLTYTSNESLKNNDAKVTLSDTYVFASQTVYENELPTYLFYKFNDDATAADRENIKKLDYLDPSEYKFLSMMYPAIRKDDASDTYYEFVKSL